MKWVRLFALATVSSAWLSVSAQTIGVSCPRFFDRDPHQKISCLESLFSQDKYHLTMTSLPPSNGFAPGVVLEHRRHLVSAAGTSGVAKKSLLDLSATLGVSTNSSWSAGGDLRWILPRGYKPPGEQSSPEDQKKEENAYIWLADHQETTTLHASVMHRSVRQLYYYGEGSQSPNQQYVFAEDDTYGSVNFRYPFSDKFAVSAEAGGSAAALPPISDAARVTAHLSSVSVPGLIVQPVFANLKVSAVSSVDSDSWNRTPRPFPELEPQDNPHFVQDVSFRMKTQASFAWNPTLDGSSYSYQQFVFSNDVELDLNYRLRNMFPPEKHPFLYHEFCGNNNKRKQQCSFGTLSTHALLTLSHTSFGQQMPFYLQPTLGGTDMQSRLTLRGWDNYRFRDRDAALLQAEYGYTIFDPFGFYVFYDAGKVGTTPADLSPLNWRQDAGIGLSVRLRRHVIAQTYVAWGAGRPQWNYNFAKSF